MVYVINAQDCDGTGAGLASLRNRLFTAITRSKAWVRVIGHGERMDRLMKEFQHLKQKKFRLDFIYPSKELLGKLRRVHRDLSPHEKQRLGRGKSRIHDLIKAFERGELTSHDIEPEMKEKLLRLLGDER